MLRVGLVGLGYWGQKMFRNLYDHPEVEVVGLADENLQVIPDESYRYQSAEALMDEEFIEALVITTPPDTHYLIAKQALEHGLHVLVEKPMTTSVTQAEE